MKNFGQQQLKLIADLKRKLKLIANPGMQL